MALPPWNPHHTEVPKLSRASLSDSLIQFKLFSEGNVGVSFFSSPASLLLLPEHTSVALHYLLFPSVPCFLSLPGLWICCELFQHHHVLPPLCCPAPSLVHTAGVSPGLFTVWMLPPLQSLLWSTQVRRKCPSWLCSETLICDSSHYVAAACLLICLFHEMFSNLKGLTHLTHFLILGVDTALGT